MMCLFVYFVVCKMPSSFNLKFFIVNNKNHSTVPYVEVFGESVGASLIFSSANISFKNYLCRESFVDQTPDHSLL